MFYITSHDNIMSFTYVLCQLISLSVSRNSRSIFVALQLVSHEMEILHQNNRNPYRQIYSLSAYDASQRRHLTHPLSYILTPMIWPVGRHINWTNKNKQN